MKMKSFLQGSHQKMVYNRILNTTALGGFEPNFQPKCVNDYQSTDTYFEWVEVFQFDEIAINSLHTCSLSKFWRK